MSLEISRVRAVIVKELREYRRTRFIVWSMAVLPVVFLILPVVNVLGLSSTASASTVRAVAGAALLFLLIIPVVVPAAIAAYSVVGERDQGTLEPLLTTPIRREELLLGKGLATILPSVAVTYVLLAVFYVTVHIAATAAVVSAVWQLPLVLSEVLFAPLLAAWAIWIGMAISARSSDVRVAQQLSTLASLPVLGVTTLISFQVIHPTVLLAIAFGAGLLLIDACAWRIASVMFDRERLVLGRSTRRVTSGT
jgi:ABC-type Na+ efflux pump permease subunit